MREIFVHQDFTRVGHYKSILDSAEIPSFIRNEISHSLVTELPCPLMFPTLCVENDADYDRALELLRKVHKPTTPDAPDWICPGCKEPVPGTFDSCWSCGGVMPETSASLASESPAVAPAPIAATPELTQSVTILRRLIALDCAFTIAWHVVGNSAFLKLDIYPLNSLTGLTMAYAQFDLVITVFAQLLCFTLSRLGRTLYAIDIAMWVLTTYGALGGIAHRWTLPLGTISTVITGAILAMLYFSPASVYFRKTAAHSKTS